MIAKMLAAACAALICLPAVAQWTQDETKDGLAIFTVVINDDSELFGQKCGIGGENADCFFMFTTSISCKDGATGPALISGPAHASTATIACDGLAGSSKTNYRYFIGPFDAVDAVARQGGTIGIAIPMDSGRFRAIRFNTAGGVAALDRLEATVTQRRKTSTKGTTF